MVARGGLIASQWSEMLIGRLSQMSPPPCLYDTVIQSYVQLKSGFKSMGQLWTLLPPRGASFTPLCGMFLQSPSASSNVANFTFLRNPLSELWVCEFWLLRWSTMVARVASVCWGDSGLAACCPESNEPTLMFLWHFYPEISLWSLSMEVYGTCC